MQQQIPHITYLVKNYDEAIAYFTQKLNFDLIEDTQLAPGKRWVRIAPNGSRGVCFLLAEVKNDEEASIVGKQAGGRVFAFLQTDDFWRDYNFMKNAGVEFMEEPRDEAYGVVVVFVDLYGNKWDLIQPK